MKNDSFTCILQGFHYLTDFTLSVENHIKCRPKKSKHQKNVIKDIGRNALKKKSF